MNTNTAYTEQGINPDSIVEVRNLSRHFNDKIALDDVNIAIPKGQVFGLVGVNGAGKTTLIKHILGLFKAKHGNVSVFGLNPSRYPEQVLSKIGYMSENPELPEWMRIGELINYTRAFYPTWDNDYAQELLTLFELKPQDKVRELSKGKLARAALLLALSHRPELLVLDEPSSGLDPLVRRDILRTVIQAVAEDGRTVIFSSHLLEEVERIADYVAMIDNGKIIAQDNLDDLKQQYLRLNIQFDNNVETKPTLPGFISWSGGNRQWSAIYKGSKTNAESELVGSNGRILDSTVANLEDLFFAFASRKHVSEA